MGADLKKMVELFSKGLEFSSSKDQYELDYGIVEVPFGRVNIEIYYENAYLATAFSFRCRWNSSRRIFLLS